MAARLLCRLRAYEQAATFQVWHQSFLRWLVNASPNDIHCLDLGYPGIVHCHRLMVGSWHAQENVKTPYRFQQVAAKQLADAHAPGGVAMPTGTATALVAAAGAALGRLADLLRSSGAGSQQKPDVLATPTTGAEMRQDAGCKQCSQIQDHHIRFRARALTLTFWLFWGSIALEFLCVIGPTVSGYLLADLRIATQLHLRVKLHLAPSVARPFEQRRNSGRPLSVIPD